MKISLLLLLNILFCTLLISQELGCYLVDSHESGSSPSSAEKFEICPQCGTGEIKHDLYGGYGSTYSGECAGGVLNGKWSIVSENGAGPKSSPNRPKTITNQSGSFKNGKKEGKWVSKHYVRNKYYGNSEEDREELNYKDGKLEGPCKIYRDGVLYLTGQYKNGERFGTWTVYGTGGEYYGGASVDDNLPVIKNGRILYEETENGFIKESIFKNNYNGDEILDQTAFYKGLLLNGLETNFLKNGEIHSITNYKDGKKEGKECFLNKKGDTTKIINYKAGIRHGAKIIFSDYGPEIKTQTSYVALPNFPDSLVKHGKFITNEYRSYVEENYNMGVKSGLFWEKRTVEKDSNYNNQKTIYIDSVYFENGKLNGLNRHYIERITSSVPELIKEERFKDGELNGVSNFYTGRVMKKSEEYSAGILKSITEYGNPNIKKTFLVEDGSKVVDYLEFNSRSLPITSGKLIQNQKEGYWFTYKYNQYSEILLYEKGQLVSTVSKEGKVKKLLKTLNIPQRELKF